MKIAACPFCGKTPTGKLFCSLDCGPSLICNGCRAQGPPALGKVIQVGSNDAKLHPKAIACWNARAHDAASFRLGIACAAEFVEMFDKYVAHLSRLSDCIRGKFNLLGKRKIGDNRKPSVAPLLAAIHYWQVCFRDTASVGHPDRVRSSEKFDREMKKLHKAR
jgi:hypothetical protein